MARARITVPDNLLIEVRLYAADTHRTFSELICKAVEQHISMYPLKQKKPPEGDLKALKETVHNLTVCVASLGSIVQILADKAGLLGPENI